MSTDTEAAPADGTSAKDAKGAKGGKGGKKKLVILVVVGLVAAGAAYKLVLAPGGGEEASAEEVEPEKGEVLELEPFTLNLAEGRYLRVGLAVQLSADALMEEFEKKGAPKAKDLLIATVGGARAEDLDTPEERDALKQRLLAGAEGRFEEHEVLGFYFTEFVMQ